jgi:sulfite exporter TauE/SafE
VQAFLLGLSNGAVCIAYCAPVLVPYLCGEGAAVRRNYSLVALFLSGRLVGYLLFAIVAWAAGRVLLPVSPWRDILIGSADAILALLLVLYGFFRVGASCAADRAQKALPRIVTRWPAALPAAIGLFTGLNLCPPFLLAFSQAAAEADLLKTIAFFFLFFLGTSLFFIPIPFVGLLRRVGALAVVGKLAAGIMGVYYFYAGLMLIIGGIYAL